MIEVGDPRALLTAAADRLAAAGSWTLTPHPDYFHLEAAVRPDVQWHRTAAIFGGDTAAVLIQDDFAYLYGIEQAAMIGWTRSDEAVEAVIGDRWLRCDAAAFLRAGNDHSTLQQVLKLVDLDSRREVRVHRLAESSAGPVAILSGGFGGVCAVRLDDPGGPMLVGFGHDPARELMASLSYGDDAPALPDLSERGVITLEAAMAGFAARRNRRPKQPAGTLGRAATVDVIAPEDGGEDWSIHSDDLPAAWGVDSGHRAEELARELLGREVPELFGELVFDSYGEAFAASCRTESTARAVAEVLGRKPV